MNARVETMLVVHPNAAGVDIGSREIWASVPPDREGETVRRFGTFTPDLYTLADWLRGHGIETVAMESTGRWTVSMPTAEQVTWRRRRTGRRDDCPCHPCGTGQPDIAIRATADQVRQCSGEAET